MSELALKLIAKNRKAHHSNVAELITAPYLCSMKLREIARLPRRLLWALVMEGVDTTKMLQVFGRHGTGKLLRLPAHRQPTEAELAEAIAQLKELPRFLPFFVVVLVPVPGVTESYALVAITLEKWLGDRFRLLPSRLKHIFAEESA